MSQPLVLTIILNWRTPDLTLKAAEAAQRAMAKLDGEILVVDNDSQDGSFEAIKGAIEQKSWRRVSVLQSGRNGGFGAGNNYGMRYAFAGKLSSGVPDYIYVLNSDAFPDEGAITGLLAHLQTHPETGFAGSYIHGAEGEPHLTAFRFPSIAGEFEGAAKIGPISRFLRHKIVALPIPEKTQTVDWLAGASMMMRRKALEQIGLFDENFFLYFEETDLCLRAARLGWKTDYVRESSVTHIGSVSTGMKSWNRIPTFWLDSRLHYFRQNHGRGYAALATLAHLAGRAIHNLRCFAQGKTASRPKFFLIDMAYHALKAAASKERRKPRQVVQANALQDSQGEQV